ncbi:hypothetical protein V1264_002589 [Littorina saxatilis]|uniref:Uncharacterized protein n=1 Tax=Littorina saxatilis TaxID=31220 RepID=A0AAN9B412_9CAEN
MEDPARLRREYQLAVLQHQHDLIDLTLYQVRASRRRRTRGERGRRNWVRPWIGRRRQFGMYDQLMVELRNEGHASFTNFLRISPAMFDELLARVGPGVSQAVHLLQGSA